MAHFTCISIDDDPLILRKMEAFIEEIDWLELKGTYNNPVQGATAVIKEEPDLLFLDIEMPYLDGYALLDWILPRLKEMETKPLIVVISGAPDKMQHDNEDVLAHISKTTVITPESIEGPLKKALEKRGLFK